MSKKIIITGASGGFGKLITQQLPAKGHHVAATMRGVTDNEHLAKIPEGIYNAFGTNHLLKEKFYEYTKI